MLIPPPPRPPLMGFLVSNPVLPVLLRLLEDPFRRFVTPTGPFAFGLELYPFEPPRLYPRDPR